MEFSREDYWSGLPFPSPGDRPNPGIKPRSPAPQADSLPSEPPWPPLNCSPPFLISFPPATDGYLIYLFSSTHSPKLNLITSFNKHNNLKKKKKFYQNQHYYHKSDIFFSLYFHIDLSVFPYTVSLYCNWWWWWFSHQVMSDPCNLVNCSLPGSSVHGFLQARILDWVAISFSRVISFSVIHKRNIFLYTMKFVCYNMFLSKE